MHTQYSGKGTAETALGKLQQFLTIEDLAQETPFCSVGSACDIKGCAQDVILEHDGPCRPEHVFTDLLNSIPAGMRQKVASLLPFPSASLADKEAAYIAIGRVLQEDLHSTFSADHKMPCRRHEGDSCPFSILQGNARGRLLAIWVAGTTRVAFSPRGKRDGNAGESMLPYRVWAALVRRCLPHIIIHEITPQEKARTMLSGDLGDLYHIESIIVSPMDLVPGGPPADVQHLLASRRDRLPWHCRWLPRDVRQPGRIVRAGPLAGPCSIPAPRDAGEGRGAGFLPWPCR